jgi:hypothetical protein
VREKTGNLAPQTAVFRSRLTQYLSPHWADRANFLCAAVSDVAPSHLLSAASEISLGAGAAGHMC